MRERPVLADMANYEAGTAFVQIVPSLANFHRAIKKALRGLADEVALPIDSGALNSSAEILSRITRDMENRVLAEFPNITPPDVTPPDVSVNTAPAREEVKRLQRDISSTTAVIGVRADTVRTIADTAMESARQRTASVRGATDVDRIRGEIDALRATTPPVEVPVDADIARAEARIRELTAKKSTVEVEFLADTRDLEAEITELRRQLPTRLASMDADILEATRSRDVLAERQRGGEEVGPDIARAEARLEQLRAQREGIDIDVNLDIHRAEARMARLVAEHERMRVQVDVDTALARQKLADLRTKTNGSGMSIGAEDAEQAINTVALLTAGLSTLGAVAPVAAASVATVPAALAGAGQVVATFVAGLNGIGDALSAMNTVRVANLTGEGATDSELETMRDALADLTPAGRAFTQFMASEFQPVMRGVGDAVQTEFLPHLEGALAQFATLAPYLRRSLSDTANAVGGGVQAAAQRMGSAPWLADTQLITQTNNQLMPSVTHGAMELAEAMRSITAAGGPALDRIAQFAETQAILANRFVQTSRASGQLGVFVGQVADTFLEFAGIAAQVAGGVGQLLAALAPLGRALAHMVANVISAVGAFAAAHPQITRLAASALITLGAFVALGRGFSGLSKALETALGGWRALLGTMSTVQTRTVATGTATHAATTALATNADASNRSSSAVGRVAAGFGRIIGVGAVVGTAVGGAALAFDGLTTSADEAANAVLRGGTAAQNAKQTIQNQQGVASVARPVLDAVFGEENLLFDLDTMFPSMESVKAKAQELYAAMTPLQQAQTDLTRAQNDYALAVQQQGPASQIAAAAQQRVAAASDRVQQAQRAASDATKSHTDRMIEQQAQAMSALDTDLALRQAHASVTQAQRQATAATQRHGADSVQATMAHQALEQAMLRAATAARDKARANNHDVDATQRDQRANIAYNRTLANLVARAGGAAPIALRRYLAGLNGAALGAIGARMETDRFGNAILVLPGEKRVFLGVRGDIEAKQRIAALRNIINTLPDDHWFTVYARMVQTAVQPPPPTPNAPPVPLPSNVHGKPTQPQGFATGGIATDLSPMRAVAQVVPPRTWRVVGDRMRGDEAYIPINGAARSHEILAETARRMGFALTPHAQQPEHMASGGLMAPHAVYTRPPRPHRTLPREGGEITGSTSAPQITVNARTDASPEHIAHVVNRHLRIQSRL